MLMQIAAMLVATLVLPTVDKVTVKDDLPPASFTIHGVDNDGNPTEKPFAALTDNGLQVRLLITAPVTGTCILGLGDNAPVDTINEHLDVAAQSDVTKGKVAKVEGLIPLDGLAHVYEVVIGCVGKSGKPALMSERFLIRTEPMTLSPT